MSIRSTRSTVTFRYPFHLTDLDGEQPAGTYSLVVDEEEISGISFVAFRRVATLLQAPAMAETSGTSRSYSIDQGELDAALAADAAT